MGPTLITDRKRGIRSGQAISLVGSGEKHQVGNSRWELTSEECGQGGQAEMVSCLTWLDTFTSTTLDHRSQDINIQGFNEKWSTFGIIVHLYAILHLRSSVHRSELD